MSLVETDEDVRALRTFSLYVKRLPIPFIQQQTGLSRATVYRDIARARELYAVSPEHQVQDIVYMNDDQLRDAQAQYVTIDEMQGLDAMGKYQLKYQLRAQINQLIQTRIKATELLTPKSGETTNIAIGYPGNVNIVTPGTPFNQIIKDLKKEGKIGNASSGQS